MSQGSGGCGATAVATVQNEFDLDDDELLALAATQLEGA